MPAEKKKPSPPAAPAPAGLEDYLDEIMAGAPEGEALATPEEEAALLAAQRGGDFSLAGKRCLAKVVDIHDGDTVRVVIHIGGVQAQYIARLAGYDSPELHPKKAAPNRDKEIAAAVAAREALREKIGKELIIIVCGAFDKYGRLLVTAHKREGQWGLGENINEWMMAAGHGTPYDGGTKTKFSPS